MGRAKKPKDLDPKGRAKNVKGGNAQQHLQRDVRRVNKAANDIAVTPVKKSGPTISKTAKDLTS